MSEPSCKEVSPDPGKREIEGDNNEPPKAKRLSTGDWQKQSQKVTAPTDGAVNISFNHLLDEISTESETSSCSSASPKSHFYKYRSMDDKCCSLDANDDDVGDEIRIKVGICAMNKKTYSRPMKEILKRLKRFCLLEFVIFPDELVLNESVDKWPVVDCLISFYSKGFPLDKAIAYAKLRKPLVINDLEIQYLLQDRREVYRLLEEEGVEIPRYAVFNRDKNGNPLSSAEDIEESDDNIVVNGQIFSKPFVEKPVNAEDHNIYIYYPSAAGGGCQILFRKIGSRSSVYSSESRIRRTGSYIYEDFMPTDGTDVKVYTVGEEYAHAEARKSPALDGKVERDSGGKEVRYPVILSAHEKCIAKTVSRIFKQTVCGFDLLRANGKSLVCDVNGFSFVKTSKKYYDDCSQLLADIILQNLAPQLWIPPQMDTPLQRQKSEETPVKNSCLSSSSTMMELRCVIAIIRHGDRTPKQKMKMVVTHRLFVELFNKHGGPEEGCLKLKKPKQLQEILDITRQLLEGQEDEDLLPIHENKFKLKQMKRVLEMYGHFSGINRKVQIKAMDDKRNYDMLTKFKGRNKKSQISVGNSQALLLILKWGGELTPMGKKEAEELGRAFRCVYPGGQGEYGRVPGFGFLRLHSTYRHDLKIYASDEGRVQMTAAAFAKGLLALEGELTPVLVSLVKSDKHVTGMLDTPRDVSGTMQRVKSRLHDHLHSTVDFTDSDCRKLAPSCNTSIIKAMKDVRNPHELCEKVLDLVKALVKQINEMCDNHLPGSNKTKLYHEESLNLMKHRWEKLQKDFWSGAEFDISLIPDIYDSVKYDYLHNRSLNLNHLPELYRYTKALADIVIPLEYGITSQEKLTISKQICHRFFHKLQGDLQYNVQQLEDTVHRLDPSESRDIATPHRHVRTRLYMTSESHVHSMISALRCGHLFNDMTDLQWKRATDYLNEVSELNYLTQIVFMQYEDPTTDPLSDDRFHIELFFSPGVKSPNTNDFADSLASESVRISQDTTNMEASPEGQTNSQNIPVAEGSCSDDALLGHSLSQPRRMSLQPMAHRVNSSHIDRKSKSALFRSSPVNNIEEEVSIRGADVIETIPALHSLVCLHSSIGQRQMNSFLNDLMQGEQTVYDRHNSSVQPSYSDENQLWLTSSSIVSPFSAGKS